MSSSELSVDMAKREGGLNVGKKKVMRSENAIDARWVTAMHRTNPDGWRQENVEKKKKKKKKVRCLGKHRRRSREGFAVSGYFKAG